MKTNLFVIGKVKQLRTDGSFRILLLFSENLEVLGVLNSAVSNSFHSRVEFGMILGAFEISGWGEGQLNNPRYATATDHIFCIRQILEGKKWEHNEAVNQLFTDLKYARESFRREVLQDIVAEFGIPVKLVRLIRMCLDEPCSNYTIYLLLYFILFNTNSYSFLGYICITYTGFFEIIVGVLTTCHTQYT